ncbi:MAG: PocR ligand-binding domain-containing protein [Bacillota bacterium]
MGIFLKDFYDITHTNVNFTSYDKKITICGPKSSNEFCDLLRSDKAAEDNCIRCDAAAFETAAKMKSRYIYQCHIELTEIIAPIVIEGKELGWFMTGGYFKTNPAGNYGFVYTIDASNIK